MSDATIRSTRALLAVIESALARRPRATPRAYGYRRVSREDQARSGLGLADQREAIKREATRQGVPLWRLRTDGGLSGELPAHERPGLMLVLKHIRPGDLLIVAKRDRIARDDLGIALLERGLAAGGIRIVSAAGEGTRKSLDDPDAAVERKMTDLVSSFELATIRKRTKAALRQRRMDGLLAGGVPYGFRADNTGRLVMDKAEQAALKAMRELRDEGRSYGEIADELAERGFKPRGSAWRPGGVHKILRTDARWIEQAKKRAK